MNPGATLKRTRWDTPYAPIGADPGQERVLPAETVADRKPTRDGRNKVYFRYRLSPAHTVTVECDLSPGFKLDDDYRLTSGHVRTCCPMPDCPGWLHIWCDRKTVYCHPTGLKSRHIFTTDDGFDGTYILPVLTVVQPVGCNYRERADGAKSGCRWHVTIAEGTAYDYMRQGGDVGGYSKSPGGVYVR